MIALLFAVAAILAQPSPDPTFVNDVLAHCTPIVRPGDFIGCEDTTSHPNDDAAFAGMLWIPAPHAMPDDALVPSLETGP